MAKQLEKNTLLYVVDSTERLSGDDSDFYVNIEPIAQYQYVSVQAMTCNKSWYTFAVPYNTFTVNGVLVTIPEGNYSRRQLESALPALLNATGVGVWTVSSNTQTAHFTFTTDYVGVVTLDLGLDRVVSRAFGMDVVEVFVGPGSIESRYVMDLQRTTALYLTSSMVSGNTQNGILHCVHGAERSFNQISYVNPSPKDTMVQINHSTSVNFKLLDDNLNGLNLNGNQLIINLVFYKDEVDRVVGIEDVASVVKDYYKDVDDAEKELRL